MMRRNWKSYALPLLPLLLLGACNKAPETGAMSGASTSGSSTATTSVDKNGNTAQKTADPSTIPANLKTEGFQYYGLEATKPIEYEISREGSPDKMTGSTTLRFDSLKGGVAKFVSEKSGILAAGQGNEEIEARPDGIYSVKIGEEPVTPAQLVMPSEPSVGKSWQSKSSVKLSDGKTYEEDVTSKVVGMEKVKSKAGEYNAIKITGNGNIKQGDQLNSATMTAWYAKGVGLVKMKITLKPANGKAATITQEATKIGG